MPRSIYQQNESQYIGHDIFQVLVKGKERSWSDTLPVYDREVNTWVRLNAETDEVDYSLTDIRHDRVLVEWEDNWDYQAIDIFVTTDPDIEIRVKTGARPTRAWVLGLTERTTYTINVLAELPWGVTLSNRQTFTTPANPVPATPVGMRYTARSNTSISLAWDKAANAASYAVYRGVENGALQRIAVVSGVTATVSLSQDTRYRFAVRGINSDGRAGPLSAILRSATGHNETRRRGSTQRLVLPPRRWGSWRSDIGWNWWYSYPEPDANLAIYQGYWAYASKRYWGVIEYDPSAMQRIIDDRFGSNTAKNMRVTEAAIRKVYRQRMAGNVSPLRLEWHLSNTQVRSGNQPSSYGRHVNDRDSADSLAWQGSLGAGTSIDMLRLPRAWGEALVEGRWGNTPVRSLLLHRGDNERNGAGFAGYMKVSGHLQPDYHLGGAGGRSSDLSLVISANWDFVSRSYKAPYNW
jgi:hypothetical protein